MVIKALLFLLAIVGAIIGIKILVRINPRSFENPAPSVNPLSNLRVITRQNSIGKAILASAASGVATRSFNAIAGRELRKMVEGKVKDFQTAAKALGLEKFTYFIFPNAYVQKAIEEWRKTIDGGEFTYSSLAAEIESRRRCLIACKPVLHVIEELLARNFALLEEQKTKIQEPALRDAILQIETRLSECRQVSVNFENVMSLRQLQDTLEQAYSFLEQIGKAEKPQESGAKAENYYDILGVDRNADHETIKKAYRELAKKYHPDKKLAQLEKITDDEIRAKIEKEYDDKLKEINEAYSVLSDPDRRTKYDAGII